MEVDMPTEFSLEIFFERDEDEELARKEASKLHLLVSRLTPHINLNIQVHKATKINRLESPKKFLYHEPVEKGSQTLLITQEEFGAEGRAEPERGCLSKQKLEEKGAKSVDITIHEWLHTIAGKEIGGRILPCPDISEGDKFACRDVNGERCWH
jgi:hypothetical protein